MISGWITQDIEAVLRPYANNAVLQEPFEVSYLRGVNPLADEPDLNKEAVSVVDGDLEVKLTQGFSEDGFWGAEVSLIRNSAYGVLLLDYLLLQLGTFVPASPCVLAPSNFVNESVGVVALPSPTFCGPDTPYSEESDGLIVEFKPCP